MGNNLSANSQPILIAEFLAAVEQGNLNTVQEFLAAQTPNFLTDNVDIENVNIGGRALRSAAQNGRAAIVELLINNGATVDRADNDGWTALMWAAFRGRAAIAELLINRGAAVDRANNDGGTALMFAAFSGHAAIAELLIDRGTAVDRATDNGWKALMLAASKGNAAIVELLIDRGAVVDRADNIGATALMWAAQNGHAATISVIVISTIAISAESEQAKANQTRLINQLTIRIQKSLNRRAVTLLSIMLEDGQTLQGLRNSIIQNFNQRNPKEPLSQEANSLFSNLRQLRQRLIAVPLNPEIANATLAYLLQGDNLRNLSSYYFPHNHNQSNVPTRLNEVEPLITSFLHNNRRLPQALNAPISQVIATFFRERYQASINRLPVKQKNNPRFENELENEVSNNWQLQKIVNDNNICLVSSYDQTQKRVLPDFKFDISSLPQMEDENSLKQHISKTLINILAKNAADLGLSLENVIEITKIARIRGGISNKFDAANNCYLSGDAGDISNDQQEILVRISNENEQENKLTNSVKKTFSANFQKSCEQQKIYSTPQAHEDYDRQTKCPLRLKSVPTNILNFLEIKVSNQEFEQLKEFERVKKAAKANDNFKTKEETKHADRVKAKSSSAGCAIC
jgi:ankyrin repeat protein